ncbi:MAG TPA: serine protease [Candidatus Binatia bacterium]|jgi:S1-C subfamily serine protease
MRFHSLPKIVSAGALALLLVNPLQALGSSLTDAKEFLAEGAGFSWEDARARSIKILVQSRDPTAHGARSSIGSGFLISPDGLFVTAYHVMKYCLGNNQASAGFSVALDCSKEHPKIEYRAENNGQEYEIEIVSYLRLADSIKGDVQTLEETVGLKDFVIARLKATTAAQFAYWPLNDFTKPVRSETDGKSLPEFKPLLPPKKVFVAGYAAGPDFALTQGFLNLVEEKRRAYLAWNRDIYDNPEIRQAYGISAGTRWGIPIANFMSGGPVIDAAGNVLGVVVNQGAGSAGILSTENVLETFFSPTPTPGAPPAVILHPTRTPLYLKAAGNL